MRSLALIIFASVVTFSGIPIQFASACDPSPYCTAHYYGAPGPIIGAGLPIAIVIGAGLSPHAPSSA